MSRRSSASLRFNWSCAFFTAESQRTAEIRRDGRLRHYSSNCCKGDFRITGEAHFRERKIDALNRALRRVGQCVIEIEEDNAKRGRLHSQIVLHDDIEVAIDLERFNFFRELKSLIYFSRR